MEQLCRSVGILLSIPIPGDLFGACRLGDDPQLLGMVPSGNVACRCRAGDPRRWTRRSPSAREFGVAVDVHPCFPGSGPPDWTIEDRQSG